MVVLVSVVLNSATDSPMLFCNCTCIVCYCPILSKRPSGYKSLIVPFFRFCYTTTVLCYCLILPICNSRSFLQRFSSVSLQ